MSPPDAAAAFTPAGQQDAALATWLTWFQTQGWTPLAHQLQMWQAHAAGESGLLHAPTGSGKTLAALGGPLLHAYRAGDRGGGPRLLWISPLRALAADTHLAAAQAVTAMGLPWRVLARSGDASQRVRRQVRDGKYELLVTTPESLALLLTHAEGQRALSTLRDVVVDEWQELLGEKRGVLLQLGLARLRRLAPGLQTWALSATIGDLPAAARAVLPPAATPRLIDVGSARPTEVVCLLPAATSRFPWAGHLGLALLPQVVASLTQVRRSLLFTNTRSQAELWFQALAAVWPGAPEELALHHGSLGAELRANAEQGLRDGSLRVVVATSSLDLGVDFPRVDQVLQIGSPKGVARLLQRAGRACHQPGGVGRIVGVPTHLLEIAEFAGVRRALLGGRVEARRVPGLCLDVLAQHASTLALGGGFDADGLYHEVRETTSFAALSIESWRALLRFLEYGGEALQSYPDYRRIQRGEDGRYHLLDRRIALRHRLSIGTIPADGSLDLRLLRGGRLGSVEERFVGLLKPGERFRFAGRTLELVRIEDMRVLVKVARGGTGLVPRWQGGQLPLSNTVGCEVAALLADPGDAAEASALAPLRAAQARFSALPQAGHLLVESLTTRAGLQICLYPFAGRRLHDGLAALCALRLQRIHGGGWVYAANDYGLLLLGAMPVPMDAALLARLLNPDGLKADLTACLDLAELRRRRFRGIARIAGLLPPALPGRAPRSLRALQVSATLLHDVLANHEPGHLLLAQAEAEVWHEQLDVESLHACLQQLSKLQPSIQVLRQASPLSFPLWAESQRGQLSDESWHARVLRAAQSLERRFNGR